MPTIVLRRSLKTLTPVKKKPKRGLTVPRIATVNRPKQSKGNKHK